MNPSVISMPMEFVVIGVSCMLGLVALIYRGLIKRQDKMEEHVAELANTVREFSITASAALTKASEAVATISAVVSSDTYEEHKRRTDEHFTASQALWDAKFSALQKQINTCATTNSAKILTMQGDIQKLDKCVTRLSVGADCE